ncbi:Nuclear intron maturase 4, mitochondrial [Vitis vinifera]|uniref:Nuclear intron maturase 4, mitochondrial n=1 Tax=Vitis vinifera TaxID=29760 RepID=A0A438FB07_VITVI|nr:Nuclear intron maturase 4, mitochondrial [Vitis vinifera]
MWLMGLPSACKRMKLSGNSSSLLFGISYLSLINARLVERMQACAVYSTLGAVSGDADKDIGKPTLAKNLAFLMEESSNHVIRPMARMELKRSFELRIKKRVKEQYVNGKFQDLMVKVIANPQTLEDAYNCIRINSNVDLALDGDNISFKSMAEELLGGSFNVNVNTFSISTKSARKEVLILPSLKLKVVQEAIRIVLEIVYRPYFSKISHGCRSGRGHSTALKYISKEISNPDWWFILHVNKKLDAVVLAKLISTMQDKIEDPNLFVMIQNMFHAQVLNLEFGGFPKGHGLPQEGVLSPILMNIYLDLFDHEFYRMSMRYEALDPGMCIDHDKSHSKLRSWFRRQLKGNDVKYTGRESSNFRVHSCRFMDEIFLPFQKCERKSYCKSSSQVKEKVRLFASQKQEAWDAGTLRIGKKWLAHGLKKVKESEIRHLADTDSVLSQISCFRKTGMETDHWYKLLLKIWLHDVKAKAAENEGVILSKYIAEPLLPKELRDSFYEFQKRAEDYVASETASMLALLPNSKSWLARRWLIWYSECDNFSEVKLIICDQLRKSCIRTLAAKYRLHETEIEKRSDTELCRIPSTLEIEQEKVNETSDSQASDTNEALMYGISYSGLCLLSLARMVSQSRRCNCFVMGCLAAAPSVYTLHVMERQKFPGWKTGFSSCIHPSLNGRRIGLCKQHLKDLYLGHISLQSIEFGAWK